MSIEKKIEDLIDAIEKNTAAVLAGKTVAALSPTVVAAAKPAKVAKPAAKIEVPAVEVPEVELEEAGPTKEDVSKAVEGLLKANKRDAAIALLKKYGAKAVSGVKESDYAAFLVEVSEIELAA